MHQSYYMICISEKLEKSVVKIANSLGQKSILISANDLLNLDIQSGFATIISLIEDIRLDIITELMEKSIVFSVMAVKKKEDLLLYYKKVKKNRCIVLKNPYIEDFLNNQPDIFEGKLFDSEACFFTGHGDYVCFNMAKAVMCSRVENSKKMKGKVPQCVIENKCYRKDRLNRGNAKLYFLQDLKAKVVFLNTCAGVCFGNRKYDSSYNSLSDTFLKNNGLIFISNYMIGAYTHEGTVIFFAMLVYYRNVGLAVCKYNQLIDEFYGKNKTVVMAGDISLIAMVSEESVETWSDLIEVKESYIVFRLRGKLRLNTITFEIDKENIPVGFNLLDTIQIDGNNDCNYRLGIILEKSLYKIFIYCNKTGFFDNEVIFYKKQRFTEWSLDVYNQLVLKSNMLNLYLFKGEALVSIKKTCDFLKSRVQQNIEIQENDKGNVEIATYIHNILIKADAFIGQFNNLFIRCFIETSKRTDTHLILNNEKFFFRKITKDDKLCSYCHSQVWKMYMEPKTGTEYYIQYICPQCEIFCISNNDAEEFDIQIELEKHMCNLCLSKLEDFVNPCVGAMIINTDINTTRATLVRNNSLMLNLELKEKVLKGLYYLRVVILENEKLTILHKSIYFSKEEV